MYIRMIYMILQFGIMHTHILEFLKEITEHGISLEFVQMESIHLIMSCTIFYVASNDDNHPEKKDICLKIYYC